MKLNMDSISLKFKRGSIKTRHINKPPGPLPRFFFFSSHQFPPSMFFQGSAFNRQENKRKWLGFPQNM